MPDLCLSLFSVALTGDGRDWVAATQFEMGITGGTRRWWSMMKAGSLSICLSAILHVCLSLSLSLLGRMLRKLFEPKKFLKLHVRCPDAAALPNYAAQPSYATHPTDQTTTPSPSPTNADQTTPPLPSLIHGENSTPPMLPRQRHASHYPDSMGRSLGGGFESGRWAAEIESGRWAVEIKSGQWLDCFNHVYSIAFFNLL
jgi:hypothetical protein